MYQKPGSVRVEGLVHAARPRRPWCRACRDDRAAQLDVAPAQAEQLSSAIPSAHQRLGLAANEVATIDLSSEFELLRNASAKYRLGQGNAHTLTQFPTGGPSCSRLRAGPSPTSAGGHRARRPQARKDFESCRRSIFVDRPVFGAAANNPARVMRRQRVRGDIPRRRRLCTSAFHHSRWRRVNLLPRHVSTSRCSTTS